MKRLFTFLLALILTGCATQKKTSAALNSWLGSTKQSLILDWGPPSQTTSDGAGGEILVYAHRVYYTSYNRPVDYWEYRMMYADAKGMIYHWLYRKSPNPPERVDVRVLVQ